MEIAAAGLLSLTLIVLYVLHARTTTRTRAEDASIALLRHQEIITASTALDARLEVMSLEASTLQRSHAAAVLAVANSLQPLVAGLTEELQVHMAFIEESQRDLKTRVEVGAGKRTLRVP